MKIAIVGTGYVGLVTGTCFAEIGVNVICVDTNSEKIESLKKGVIPIYENGLEEMVSRNVKAGRLQFTTSLESCLNEVEVVFSAVGTPPDEDGSADLSYVLEVARTIGRNMQKYVLVVTKSTVPVGTARKVRATIQEELDKRGMNIDFDVASNPEFLKEGNAINDFMSPDRVVVGVESERAKKIMSKGQVAVQMCKAAVNEGLDTDLETGVAYEAEVFGLCFATADQKEGMAAFVEKRKASFVGK